MNYLRTGGVDAETGVPLIRPADDIARAILDDLDEAETRAWESLRRYKFQMFGYWAAIWVHLNRITGAKRANPWRDLVLRAREERDR